MEKPNQLANRFREILLNGKWIANTNYKEQLSDVSWEQATQQIGSLNTIRALTYHINYYIEGILNFFDGGDLDIKDKYSFDVQDLNSASDWEKFLIRVWSNAERFAVYVESFSEEQLEKDFVDPKYGTYRRNIEGMIEHCYYHLGQISLIKKLLMS